MGDMGGISAMGGLPAADNAVAPRSDDPFANMGASGEGTTVAAAPAPSPPVFQAAQIASVPDFGKMWVGFQEESRDSVQWSSAALGGQDGVQKLTEKLSGAGLQVVMAVPDKLEVISAGALSAQPQSIVLIHCRLENNAEGVQVHVQARAAESATTAAAAAALSVQLQLDAPAAAPASAMQTSGMGGLGGIGGMGGMGGMG